MILSVIFHRDLILASDHLNNNVIMQEQHSRLYQFLIFQHRRIKHWVDFLNEAEDNTSSMFGEPTDEQLRTADYIASQAGGCNTKVLRYGFHQKLSFLVVMVLVDLEMRLYLILVIFLV